MRRFVIILFIVLFLIEMPPVSESPAQAYTVDEVKAAMVLRFLIYVKWPESANGKMENFECRILGDGGVSDLLVGLDGEKLMDKTIRIRRISDIGELGDCHLLFISSSEKNNLPAILEMVGEKPVLTVGDITGFAKKGGIINFVRKKGSIGFEINPEAGKRAGLTISSKLLRSATIVK